MVKFSVYLNSRVYVMLSSNSQFRCLQITASIRFVFIEAYVVGAHLNCSDLLMQFK